MRKFLIATHGTFAKGIKSSLDIIIGQVEHVFLIAAYVDGNKSVEGQISNVLEEIGVDDELIIFTDLMGGSITNQALRLGMKEKVHIVAGFNLPLLIDVLMADSNMPTGELIAQAVQNAREQIVYVNNLIQSNNEPNTHD